MTAYTHRIRHCDGKTKAWLLCPLDSKGGELLIGGCYQTAMSLDTLLQFAGAVRPKPGDVVQIIYNQKDNPTC